MPAPAQSTSPPGATRYRWLVVTLLFTAMVINYVDRQTVSLLKPSLQAEFGWSETDYADLIFWFQFAYAISYLAFGRIVDRFGARAGFSVAFLIWQAAHIGRAFPAGVKAVSEWFPRFERAFAMGLFNAGTNIGAIVTPLVIPAITLAFGWQAAFIVTGVAGLIWLPVWWFVYRRPREHTKINALELAHIEQDPVAPVQKVSWLKVIRTRETWGYALGKFLIDPIWWMFLFWLPDFLHKRHGLDLKTFGPPLVAIYLLSDIGSVGGGWLSSQFIKRGWSVNAARKLTMLICAALALPVGAAALADNLWVAVLIIGVATAAHQGFSANLYTLPSDVFPNGAVGSVVGIGGMFGAFGGMAMAKYAGFVLDKIGSYTPIFVYAATGYFLALLAVHLLMPKLEPAKLPA